MKPFEAQRYTFSLKSATLGIILLNSKLCFAKKCWQMEIWSRIVDREQAQEMRSRELIATLIDVDAHLLSRKVGDVVHEQTFCWDAQSELPLAINRFLLEYGLERKGGPSVNLRHHFLVGSGAVFATCALSQEQGARAVALDVVVDAIGWLRADEQLAAGIFPHTAVVVTCHRTYRLLGHTIVHKDVFAIVSQSHLNLRAIRIGLWPVDSVHYMIGHSIVLHCLRNLGCCVNWVDVRDYHR